MIYVLKSRPYLNFDKEGDGYFTGEFYFFQKEKYAVCERSLEQAKTYKSLKRALTAAEKSLVNFDNYVFDVVGIENGEEVEIYKVV